MTQSVLSCLTNASPVSPAALPPAPHNLAGRARGGTPAPSSFPALAAGPARFLAQNLKSLQRAFQGRKLHFCPEIFLLQDRAASFSDLQRVAGDVCLTPFSLALAGLAAEPLLLRGCSNLGFSHSCSFLILHCNEQRYRQHCSECGLP